VVDNPVGVHACVKMTMWVKRGVQWMSDEVVGVWREKNRGRWRGGVVKQEVYGRR
jgi:hypothetical protein